MAGFLLRRALALQRLGFIAVAEELEVLPCRKQQHKHNESGHAGRLRQSRRDAVLLHHDRRQHGPQPASEKQCNHYCGDQRDAEESGRAGVVCVQP